MKTFLVFLINHREALGSFAWLRLDGRKSLINLATDGYEELAKRKGIKFGRKHSLTEEQVQEVKAKRDQGIKILDLMSEYKISKASIYRALAQ